MESGEVRKGDKKKSESLCCFIFTLSHFLFFGKLVRGDHDDDDAGGGGEKEGEGTR